MLSRSPERAQSLQFNYFDLTNYGFSKRSLGTSRWLTWMEAEHGKLEIVPRRLRTGTWSGISTFRRRENLLVELRLTSSMEHVHRYRVGFSVTAFVVVVILSTRWLIISQNPSISNFENSLFFFLSTYFADHKKVFYAHPWCRFIDSLISFTPTKSPRIKLCKDDRRRYKPRIEQR